MSKIHNVDILIIGGGPTGYAAAFYAKQMYKDAKVVMIRREDFSIIPCAIPYIFYTFKDPTKCIAHDHPLEELGVEIFINEVKSINSSNRIALLDDGTEINYKRLILATGSIPSKLGIPGEEGENIYYIYKDFKYLKKLFDAVKEIDRVTIIGGGIAGVEIGEEIAKLGKKVTIVEILPHCLQLNFDVDYCEIAENELKKIGITIKTNTKVIEFVKEGNRVKAIKLSNGEVIDTDLVIITVGLRPNTELAKAMGIQVNDRGFIIVDSYMRTNLPDVFAIGDCAEKRDFLTNKPVPAMLSSIGCMEAKIAVCNLMRLRFRKEGVVPTLITKIGDHYMSSTGYTEWRARNEGLDVNVEIQEVHNKHPAVFPDTQKIKLKLIVLKDTGQIIGAQIISRNNIADLTNMISVLISKGFTIEDLISLQIGTQPLSTPPPITYPVRYTALRFLMK